MLNRIWMVFVLLFSVPLVFSSQEPLWTKEFGPPIGSVVLSENGDLVGVNARIEVHLFDKNGNELFNKRSTLGPTIGFYNYSNNGFYCTFPTNYFYDTGLEEPRELEFDTYRQECISKVIDNWNFEGSSFNVTEVYHSRNNILTNTGKPVLNIDYNTLALVNDSIFSANFIASVLYFWKHDFKQFSYALAPALDNSWDYGLGGYGLSVDMSKDGKLIAAGSQDNHVYLFNNSGELLWKYDTGGDVYKILIPKSTEKNYVIAVSRDGFFRKFNEEGEVLLKRELSGNVEAISLDGTYVRIMPGTNGQRMGYYRQRLVILTNSIDKKSSLDIVEFLENEMEVIYSDADDFSKYRKEMNILILGGPQAYGGVGEIVKEVLSGGEESSIIEGTNEDVFIERDVWEDGQRVFVIGGKDREQTKRIFNENKNDILV